MFQLCRFSLTILLGLMVTLSALADGGLLRRDFGLGISLGSTFADETAGGIFYQHSGGYPGIEIDLRFGLRTEIFSLGLTGAYGLAWVNSVKKADAGVYEKYRYDAHQILGGGFATYNLWGGSGKDNTEVLFEYYAHAGHTIKYSDDSAQNPFRVGDTLKGNGWGAGVGGARGESSVWLIYRSLNLTDAELGSNSYTWPSSTHSRVHVQTVTLLFGKSI